MQWISIGLMASGKAWRFGGLEMGGKTSSAQAFYFFVCIHIFSLLCRTQYVQQGCTVLGIDRDWTNITISLSHHHPETV